MFKVILASFFGLALFAAEALAAGSYYCQSCGNPYTASGRQTFANFAHNLAWGSNPVRINYNGTGGRANTGWNNAAWQLRVTNSRGRTVTVRYEPSAWTITKKNFGLGKGDIDTFDLVLPDGQVEPARVVYNPGKNYKLGGPAPQGGYGQSEAAQRGSALGRAAYNRWLRTQNQERNWARIGTPPPPCHSINNGSGTRCYKSKTTRNFNFY